MKIYENLGGKHEQCENTVLNNVEIHDLSSKNDEGIYIDDTKDTVGKTVGSLAWVWLEAPNS